MERNKAMEVVLPLNLWKFKIFVFFPLLNNVWTGIWHRYGYFLLSTINMNEFIDVFRVFMFIVIYISFLPNVLAYYCNHDLCREDQYCCGDNLCCDYVYSLWYFWFGVVFLVIILSLCGGFFRYCYDNNSYVIVQTCKSGYFPPPSVDDEEKTLNTSADGRSSSPPPSYPEDYEKGYKLYSSDHQITGSNRSHFQNSHNPNLLVHFN